MMMQAYEVVLPCQLPTWSCVKIALAEMREQCLKPTTSIDDICKLFQNIIDVTGKCTDTISTNDMPSWHNRSYRSGRSRHGQSNVWFGFCQFLKQIDHEERNKITGSTMPAIIKLAIDIEHFPTSNVQLSVQEHESTTVLTRSHVASILACGFFCLYPTRSRNNNGKLNEINFTSFFNNISLPSQMAKLRCILNYFQRITGVNEEERRGTVTYTRNCLEKCSLPVMGDYVTSDDPLCPLTIHHDGHIEDIGSEAMEVDFANKFIGGGSLGKGCVQEEIRFMACPELVASQLFMESMEDNEAIIISGYKQYSQHSGYAQSFSYNGDNNQQMEEENMMCCIDATSFRNKAKQVQYTDKYILRELNKALIGFTGRKNRNEEIGMKKKTILKDRSSSEEEFLTAVENSADESSSDSSSRYISEYAGKMLNGLLSQATREAIEKGKLQKKAKNVKREDLMMAAGNLVNIENMMPKSSEHSLAVLSDGQIIVGGTDQVHVHTNLTANTYETLDVEYGDWLSNFRRRSSNLSDINSRRSSSSTKHSSDLSSELDDLYESYMKSEKLKHGTIQEESYETISDFATKLISCLMFEGTSKAASMLPSVQDFDDCPSIFALKPIPIQNSDQIASNKYMKAAENVAERILKSVITFAMLQAVSVIGSKNSTTDFTNTSLHSSSENIIPDATYAWFAEHIVQNAFIQACDEVSPISVVDNVVNHLYLDLNISRDSGSSGDSNLTRLTINSAADDSDLHSSLMSDYDSSTSSVISEKRTNSGSKVCHNILHERVCNSSHSEAAGTCVSENVMENSAANHGHTLVLNVERESTSSSANFNDAAAYIVQQIITGLPKRLEEEEPIAICTDNICNLDESQLQREKNRSREQIHTVTFADNKSGLMPWSNFSKREETNKKLETSNVGILTKKLSRETLTNAYLKVENRRQTKSYERRSSAPCHISVQRSLQALDNEKAACDMDKRNRKISRTDEDFDRFKADSKRRGSWDIMPYGRRRSSSGFKDPILSRFAEELMKADTSIPLLHIAQKTGSSTTGSRRSSISAFKDMTLANFEMELLGSSFEASSSPKQNSLRRKSRDSKLVKSDSSEAEEYVWFPVPRRVGVEFQENYERLHNYHSVDEIEDFADMIAHNVLQEAVDILHREQELDEQYFHLEQIEFFANEMSKHVLDSAFVVLKKQKTNFQLLSKCSSTHCENKLFLTQDNSVEDYHDVLDVEIKILEDYADRIVEACISESLAEIFKPKHKFDQFRCNDKSISTGNWGCGAFRGDPHIKSILQWMAASIVQSPMLHYFIFGDPRLIRFSEVVKFIEERKWRVGEVMKAINQYCDMVQQEDMCYDDDLTSTFSLFDFILTL